MIHFSCELLRELNLKYLCQLNKRSERKEMLTTCVRIMKYKFVQF
jgi:hypothetical protein